MLQTRVIFAKLHFTPHSFKPNLTPWGVCSPLIQKLCLVLFTAFTLTPANADDGWVAYFQQMKQQGINNVAAQGGFEIGGGKYPNGAMGYIDGGSHCVVWGDALKNGIEPWGHVHPFNPDIPTGNWTAANPFDFTASKPSPADITFTINNGGSHIVHTSYQWDPHTNKLVPLTNGNQFNVLIEIPNPSNPSIVIFQPLDGVKPIPGTAQSGKLVQCYFMGLQPDEIGPHRPPPTSGGAASRCKVGAGVALVALDPAGAALGTSQDLIAKYVLPNSLFKPYVAFTPPAGAALTVMDPAWGVNPMGDGEIHTKSMAEIRWEQYLYNEKKRKEEELNQYLEWKKNLAERKAALEAKLQNNPNPTPLINPYWKPQYGDF